MDTKLLTSSEKDIELAAEIISNGGNVIFPTETVYGLGANAFDKEAVLNIFKAKGRPSDNPLIVHISDISMLSDIAREVPDNAMRIIDKYWPGPLTIILKKSDKVPYETTAGLDTVAIRMPVSEVARKLIEFAKCPIAAPSANLSGKPSPTTFAHCVDDMMGRVEAIIEGDDCLYGVESTVVDLSGKTPILYRPGAVTLPMLSDILGEVETCFSQQDGKAPKSPGLKYKHYSPNADVIILKGSQDEVKSFISSNENNKIGLLVFDEFESFDDIITISLGSIKNPHDAMHNLFSALRRMDELGVKTVYAPEIADIGVWSAVRNRLYRAAGHNILDLSHNKKRILFICTGNTCRSPMAEAIFNKLAEEKNIDAVADSAGIYADGSNISENSKIVLNEIGIDISKRDSKNLTRELIDNSDIVLTMTSAHKNGVEFAFPGFKNIYTLSEFLGIDKEIADPYGGDVDDYRVCRDEIYNLILKVIEKL